MSLSLNVAGGSRPAAPFRVPSRSEGFPQDRGPPPKSPRLSQVSGDRDMPPGEIASADSSKSTATVTASGDLGEASSRASDTLFGDDWDDYPRNLKSYIPVIDYHPFEDQFFTYKSLFSASTCVDVFDLHGGSPSYRAQLNDESLRNMLLVKEAPDVRVIFIDRVGSGGVEGSGRYTTTMAMMKKLFSLHEVPMDFLRSHATEKEMTWPVETRNLLKDDGKSVDTNSFEFWYNTKLRTKVLRGKGENKVKQMAVYHRCNTSNFLESTIIYVVGADDIIKERFRQLRFPWSSFNCFSIHIVILSRLLDCYTEMSQDVRDVVKILTTNQSPQGLLSDPHLSRFIHRKAESSNILEHELELLLEVIHHIRRHHNSYRTHSSDPFTAHRIEERLSSMVSSAKQLKMWCQKCYVMMSGQLSLAYSSISQADSRANIQIAMLAQKDSRRTAIISYVTILFLPPTAVASIFGTNFFNFGPDGFQASSKIWIFFVSTVIVTVLVFAGWALWKVWENSHSDDEWDAIRPSGGARGIGGDPGSANNPQGGVNQAGFNDTDSLYRYKEGFEGGIKPLGRTFTVLELAGGGARY